MHNSAIPVDRSQEFFRYAQKLQAIHEIGQHSERSEINNRQVADAEAELGAALKEIDAKLAEVHALSKRASVIDEKTAEIQALTFQIRQAIISVNTQIEAFAKLEANCMSSRHGLAHHRSVVQNLRVRCGQLTMRLKETLDIRAQYMEANEKRHKLYSYTDVSRWNPQFNSQADDVAQEENNRKVDEESLFVVQTTSHQSQGFYQAAREEAVENVQKMVADLAQIFNRVASLVSAQEELTVRIEDDMASALHNIYQGELQLLKYFTSIVSNRSFLMKMFALLISFIVFFVIFIL